MPMLVFKISDSKHLVHKKNTNFYSTYDIIKLTDTFAMHAMTLEVVHSSENNERTFVDNYKR